MAEELGLRMAGSCSEGTTSRRLMSSSYGLCLAYRIVDVRNRIQSERKKSMSMVLQLQKLVPAGNAGEMSVILMSTASGICPTTAITDGDNEFQME